MNENPTKKYYIVDFNGVKTDGLDGIEKLTENDTLIIFFVKGESAVDFSLLSKLYSCQANLTMKEIATQDLILPVISMYIGSISIVTPEIYLICSDGDDYLKSAEIAIGKDIKISVQQNISGDKIRCSDDGIRRVSEPIRLHTTNYVSKKYARGEMLSISEYMTNQSNKKP